MKAFVTYLKKNLLPCSLPVGQLVGLNCQTDSAGTLVPVQIQCPFVSSSMVVSFVRDYQEALW